MSAAKQDAVHEPTKNWIQRWCRKLRPDDVDWTSASVPTKTYNCMGYAVGILKWWQPWIIQDGIVLNPEVHWLRSLPSDDDSIGAYVAAATSEGFTVCDGPEPEAGYEKIVLYFASVNDKPFRHAARILSAELWDSKVGPHSDFKHSPDAFDDVVYWSGGRLYMKRAKQC